MSCPSKKLDSKAQQALEFSIMVALIVAGIIIMGPYVIRSWNANMKTTEDSVTDSFRDPLKKVPPPDIDVDGCSCGDWQYGNCGGGTSDCPPTYREKYKICTPTGCEEGRDIDISDCEEDQTCCTWYPIGCCPDKVGLAQVEGDCGKDYHPVVCTDDDNVKNTVPDDTIREWNAACLHTCTGELPSGPEGASGIYYRCKNVLASGGNPVDPKDEIELTEDTPWSFVEEGGCIDDDAHKCQIECLCPYCPHDD